LWKKFRDDDDAAVINEVKMGLWQTPQDFYQGIQTLVSRWHKAIKDRNYVEKQSL
jgi:hypothetical protein